MLQSTSDLTKGTSHQKQRRHFTIIFALLHLCTFSLAPCLMLFGNDLFHIIGVVLFFTGCIAILGTLFLYYKKKKRRKWH